MSTVTLAELYAATCDTPERVEPGHDGRSISYVWPLPKGTELPDEDPTT